MSMKRIRIIDASEASAERVVRYICVLFALR